MLRLRPTFVSVLLVVAAGLPASAQQAPARKSAAPTPEEIEKAIGRGKEALYKLQNADGNWEVAPAPVANQGSDSNRDGTQWGGNTAMAVYALLSCGERPTEPRLQKAIQLLQTQSIVGTYAVSFKCLVWLHLPATPEVKRAMNRDARLLRSMARAAKNGTPVWDYGPGVRRNAYSLSRTQYATLGLWAASELDVEVPVDFWRLLEKTWETSQQPTGGWKYTFEADIGGEMFNHTTVCMTAAALASLYIAQDFTKGDFYAGAKGNATSEPIERGLKWLAANFQERVTPPKSLPREFVYPQLYALERVGLASGLRRFGEHDWYAHGAKWLLEKQSKAGTWNGSFGPIADTSWAILFLQRGQTPVAFNKLDYSPGVTDARKATWNQRPRDIANLTRWLSRSLERDLRWQIVRSDSDLAGLLESPILYLAGDSAVEFKPEAKKLLKDYVEHGGMIVVNADVSKADFTRSITALGTDLFPGTEWRDLPDDHPIWANQNYKREAMKGRVALRGLSNGVRELILLMPTGDPARAWQLRNPNQRTETWQTAANVLSYATDKTRFYSRGYTWLAPTVAAKPNRSLTVAQLKYQGNWNPEPQALPQLAKYALAKKSIDLKTAVIEAGQPIEKVDLLVVSGTSEFTFDEAARKAIKAYVEKGGTILFETAGGMGAFATSAESELSTMFGAQNLKQLPATHAIFGTELKVEYRPFNMSMIGNLGGPSLRGVEQNGRVVALLSREDLSAGWLGVPTDGILGYAPDTARAMAANILASLTK